MSPGRLGRRALLAGLLGAGATGALERIPAGGTLRLEIPWRLDGVDPHDLHDPAAALLGPALFDTLYGAAGTGPFPSLAHTLPEARPDGALAIELRPQLLGSDGRRLTAADVAWSLERSRARGAAGVLAPFSTFRAAADRPAVVTRGPSTAALAEALTTPVTAIVTSRSTPARTDGTGAFRLEARPWGLELLRNVRAARGAAFLERVTVRAAGDLAAALRAFEAGDADLGWLGAGLHGRRKDAAPFEGPPLGWVVLRTGREAGAWSAPGIAQALADGVGADRLAPLGLREVANARNAAGWTGAPSALLVDEGSPHLLEIARTLAAALGRPGHAVTATGVPHGELAARRASGAYTLMLDFVRSLGDRAPEVQLALLTAERPALARRPPRVAPPTARDVARTLTLGVVGRLAVVGAVATRVRGIAGWSLGDVWVGG
jgi:peptide/nickel transport system substrate-binding protein